MSRTASLNLLVWMYPPKTLIDFVLSSFRRGVPVKPIRTAFGRTAFIASWSSPECVRWHSSTKTVIFPLGEKSCGNAALRSFT